MSKQLWCAAALALAACTYDGVDVDAEARRRSPAPDAPAAPSPDAPPPSGDVVTVSCYSEGAPNTTCASPDHCCFTNYSSYHNGYCTTNACAWSTITCDGAEDCASGESCCGVQSEFGWVLACQSSCAGANEELCHPGDTCKNGGTCVSAYGVNYDFPRTLYICR